MSERETRFMTRLDFSLIRQADVFILYFIFKSLPGKRRVEIFVFR